MPSTTCPRCADQADRLLATSRVDNTTMICPHCGKDEGLEAFAGVLTPSDQWPVLVRRGLADVLVRRELVEEIRRQMAAPGPGPYRFELTRDSFVLISDPPTGEIVDVVFLDAPLGYGADDEAVLSGAMAGSNWIFTGDSWNDDGRDPNGDKIITGHVERPAGWQSA